VFSSFGYGKVHQSLFQGRLREYPAAMHLMSWMIPLANRHGELPISRMLFYELAKVPYPYADYLAALAFLAAPDPQSRNPEHEGRRIVWIDDESPDQGWFLTSYELYREAKNSDELAEKSTSRKVKHRLQSAGLPEGGGPCAYCNEHGLSVDRMLYGAHSAGAPAVIACGRCAALRRHRALADFLNDPAASFIAPETVLLHPVLSRFVERDGDHWVGNAETRDKRGTPSCPAFPTWVPDAQVRNSSLADLTCGNVDNSGTAAITMNSTEGRNNSGSPQAVSDLVDAIVVGIGAAHCTDGKHGTLKADSREQIALRTPPSPPAPPRHAAEATPHSARRRAAAPAEPHGNGAGAPPTTRAARAPGATPAAKGKPPPRRRRGHRAARAAPSGDEHDDVAPVETGFQQREAFREFWASYPRQVAAEAAWRIWQREVRCRAVFQAVMYGLVWHRQREWTDRPYGKIPYPTTWLAEKRWQFAAA
jgi:hypothetical protein